MPVSVQLNTPLADALNSAIQPKLEQYGWATGGADDAALTEYIILMLVNGKTQEEVTRELSTDLLGLDPNDPGLLEFANWLFSTIDALSTQFGSGDAQADAATGAAPAASGATDEDQDMDMSTNDGVAEFNVPTGPKAMRNGPDRGRGKRLVGQLNRAMDRTHENVLHRVRGATGNERINSHTRTPPTGPRMGTGRQPRGPNQRAANIAHGLASMNPMSNGPPGMNGGGMGPMNGWGMMPGQPPQSDLLQMMEVQQQMLNQMQQQLMMQQGGGAANGQGRGKSLFERTQHPNQRGNFRGRGGHHQNGGRNHTHQSETSKTDSAEQGEGDQDMSGAKREAANPEETVCRFNLSCTNKDCKFAHQSPAAPPGTTVDIQDVCSFGAACKNFKCVGRHPSPATRMAHQSEQDCKFWPNCQNARCPFKHPSKPPCRNGADCKTPGCEFYHNTVLCKFRPCTNRYCQFKHEEGQRGSFPDKVWTAEGTKEHVSERQFADAKAAEEQVIPGSGDDAMGGTEATVTG